MVVYTRFEKTDNLGYLTTIHNEKSTVPLNVCEFVSYIFQINWKDMTSDI